MMVNSILVRSRARNEQGRVVSVTPESAGWRYVGLDIHRALRSGPVELSSEGREQCIVLLSGECEVEVDGRPFAKLGGRASPFDGLPSSLYAPPGVQVTLAPRSDIVEVAVANAPASGGIKPYVIPSNEVEVEVRGSGLLQRNVRKILMEDRPADSLLVVEVVVPPGHWAGYPAHKHDEENLPYETYLEEIYYHRLRRPEGFAIQRVYTRDRNLDETLTVRDGDVVLIPRGYHPACAGPGYDLYFLNAMAGPVRQWRFTIDPDQEWLLHQPGD
jgi:5-deoxy-glucuronate isomerase